MKIGILGCGYVGQSIALKWKREGHLVTVTTRDPQKIQQLQSIANQVHLLEPNNLPSFITQQQVLLVSVAPDHCSSYLSTYLQTAEQIATCIPTCLALRHLIYTSSTSVYGDQGGAWVDENTPITYQNENSKILHETEQTLLKCSSEKLDVCILRLGEIYGPGREFFQRLKRMQFQSFAGTGQSYTNIIHLIDIVESLNFVLKHRLKGIYNLCNDLHLPRQQFYDQICHNIGLPPTLWDATRLSLHAGNRRVANHKIKSAGFKFTYPYQFS